MRVTHTTATVAASILGVTRQRVYQLIKDGKLDAYNVKGSVIMVSVESIEKRLEAVRNGKGA